MTKWLIKRPDGTVTLALSDNKPTFPFIEEGWEILENQEQEFPTEHRDTWKIDDNGFVYADSQLAVAKKLNEIRRLRDIMLKKSDEKWVEFKSKGMDTTDIENDKASLRDLPGVAEAAMLLMSSIAEINAHDAFAALNLSASYE
jgi:hypothetical protein